MFYIETFVSLDHTTECYRITRTTKLSKKPQKTDASDGEKKIFFLTRTTTG